MGCAFTVEEALLPDDILTAILALAKQASGEERFYFPGRDSTLQRVFLKLAQECQSKFLDRFVFADSGPEPYSPILSESISRLQLSGFIGRENPDYDFVFLKSAAEQYFDQELRPQLSKADLLELQRVAKGFRQLAKE